MKKYMKNNNIYVDDKYFKENSNGAITIVDSGFGTQLELNSVESDIELLSSMIGGDIEIAVDPVTLGSSAAAVNAAIAGDGFTRTVAVSIVNSNDDVLPYNKTLPIEVVAVTDGDGDASVVGSTVTFVNGVASVVITYTGAWAAADTCTLTVGDTSSILGYSVSNKTSVDTLVE